VSGLQESTRETALLSRAEAARYCRIHVETFRYYERQGTIAPAKIDEKNRRRWYERDALDRFLRQHARVRSTTAPRAGDVAARAFAFFEQGENDVAVVMGLRLVPAEVSELRSRWAMSRGSLVLTPEVTRDIRRALADAGYPTEPEHWPEAVRSLVRCSERLSALDVSRGAQQARPDGEGTGKQAKRRSAKGRSANGERAAHGPRASRGVPTKRNGKPARRSARSK
jgi:hypothetical protein